MKQAIKKTIATTAGAEKKKKNGKNLESRKEKDLRVLILEDNPADAELMGRQLNKDGIDFAAERVDTRSEFLKALKTREPDLILADYKLPKFDGLQALQLRNKIVPLTPFIIITGSISEEVAVECMKQGADDYLLKDRLTRLGEAVRHALEKRLLQAEKRAVEESLRASELLYRTFIDSGSDMAFLKDDCFRHLLANRELCRFYGKKENEILGKTDFELMERKAAQKCEESDRQALAENTVHASEETIGDRTYETRKFPVKLVDGRIGIGGYIRDISAQIQAESKIYESEAKYRLISENSADVIWILDIASQRFIYISPSVFKLRGLTPEQVMAEPMAAALTPESYQSIVTKMPGRIASLAAGDESARVQSAEVDQVRRDGSIVHTEAVTTLLTDADGRVTEILGVTRDITDRKHAEAQIQKSLQEKEVLLKEIHHRVKNNLQVISGLLTLQAAQMNDERLQKMIKESQSRIWTMALIHQTLYQSGNMADIDMAEYIRTLCGNLLSSYAQVAMPPTINFELVTVRLVVDKAIPLALIINELVTNAMKHAFPEGRPGEILISLQERRGKARRAPADHGCAPGYELTVADNGSGLPAGFDPKDQKSLGLQLVAMLTKQLGGTLAFASRRGTSVRIEFSDHEKIEKHS